VHQSLITNKQPYLIRVNWPIWGALEAQATTPAGEPAPAGKHFQAERVDTGERFGEGTTDPSGYVVVTPVPANGSVVWRVVPR
jgi:hypothetical protein